MEPCADDRVHRGLHPVYLDDCQEISEEPEVALRHALEAAMTGREYAAVLREAAEFFDAHPYLPVPDGAHSLVLYYEHPSPAEIRWLTAILADEGFQVQSTTTGTDLWTKLNRATVVLAIPPFVLKPN